jgi:hypothetical protein
VPEEILLAPGQQRRRRPAFEISVESTNLKETNKNLGFISDGAWFYSFLRVLRHDFCSIVSNERFLIQNRVIEAFPTPKAEK